MDCFISYSTYDEPFARHVADILRSQNVSVFMAASSLQPGDQWSQEIRSNLNASSWVILLASRAGCASPYVHQEVGMAMAGNKRIVPVVRDMDPSQLPGWLNQSHALNIRGMSVTDIHARITQIAIDIKADKAKGLLVAGSLMLGLLWLASRGS